MKGSRRFWAARSIAAQSDADGDKDAEAKPAARRARRPKEAKPASDEPQPTSEKE